MTAERDFILAPPTVSVEFGLEPVFNVMNSLHLLNAHETRSGLGAWIEATQAALTPERRHLNVVIFDALYKATEPPAGLQDFPTFIDWVAHQNAVDLRDSIISTYAEKLSADPAALLADKQVFLSALEETYAKKWAEKGEEINWQAHADGHDLLQDPANMLTITVEHLRFMWEQFARPEWERTLPMLQESIDAFRRLDYRGMTALEAARIVTGRDLTGFWPELDTAPSLRFVPTPHLGPYVTFMCESSAPYLLLFGARVPEGSRVRSPALSRSELLVRLSALADDTRLRILELLTRHEELCAQDIIDMLELSQSSASRHLRQLTATGYLVERRREVAKCYRLNMTRFDDILTALRQFIDSRR